MHPLLKIGIIGEYDPELRYHRATEEALSHAANKLSVLLTPSWISTESLADDSVDTKLKPFQALWCAPGDYKSLHGALQAIQFAREKGWPFIGT